MPGGPSVTVRLTGGSTLVVRLHPEGRPEEKLLVKRHGYSVLRRAQDGEGFEETGAFGGGGLGSQGASVRRIRFDPGTYTISFSTPGYRDVRIGPFEITAEADTAVDVELIPE